MPLVIIPSIDLRDGRVVRLQQGDYDRQINYDVDPVRTACDFAAAGAQWMHIVDLDGARTGRPAHLELISRIIAVAGLRAEVGGGVRTTEDIQRLLDAGACRVVVGTRALEDWRWFEDVVRDPRFAGRIVLALDARDGMVATRGWTHSTGRRAVELAAEVSGWPLAAILYTDVARDGMMEGPNLQQTRAMVQAGRVPVIASGGVGSIQHIRALRNLGVWGAIIGRSLYEGRVNLREAIAEAAIAGSP